MNNSRRRVAIVGGGLAGLATAAKIHLLDPAIELLVLESADRLGGVIHTERQAGFVIDHGADMFATEPDGVIELCRQIGIDDQLIEPQLDARGARVVRAGQLVPIPEGFVVMRATKWMPIVTTPLLSIGGKLRLFAERWVKPANLADESIGDFVRRRMGRQVLDRIVAPLAAGIYTGDVDRLSMRATMGPIVEMERRYGSISKANSASTDSSQPQNTGARYDRFRSFRGGMIDLIHGLEKSLPANSIQLRTAVTAVRRREQRFEVDWQDADQQTHTGEFDRVVVATPARVAARLVEDSAPLAAAELSTIESTSTAIVVLGLRRSEIRKDIATFGFVVPATERRQILAGSFASNKFAGRAPDDCVIVRVFFGGALQAELLKHTDQELIEIACRELGALIGFRGTPVVTRVVRWNDAMPQYHVGHLDRVARIEAAIAAVPGLTLISNSLRGVGIAPLVQAADKAARQIVGSA
jgi:oxygen-dependent protoporphyrinogen oxidase